MKMKKILIIYTGGTIGMVKDYENKSLRPFNFENIYKRLPEIRQLDCEIKTISFQKLVDSSDIEPDDWIYMAQIIRDNYSEYDGFVILHGTDTMSFSASAISFMLKGLKKPVIFTGSQLPIGDLRTDAKENLITSIYIATLKKDNYPLVQEVCIYFEYKLYRANRTTKFSAEQFDAFMSPNFNCLAESGVHITLKNNLIYSPINSFSIETKFCREVAILKIFPGILESSVKAILAIPNLKGLVLETFGAGNAMTSDWFIDAIEQKIKEGLIVVNATQCLAGSVKHGKYEASVGLEKIGVISCGDMTIESAITKLMFGLGSTTNIDDFKSFFISNVAGELT